MKTLPRTWALLTNQNQKSLEAINKLSASSLFFMDCDRTKQLWEIRKQTEPFSEEEILFSGKLMDENYTDLMEFIDRHLWF